MLTIYPRVIPVKAPSYANKANFSTMPKQTQHISFGDGDCPDCYNYESVLKDRANSGEKIEGETPELAFSKFYDDVQLQLTQMKKSQDSLGSNRSYYVGTGMMGDSKTDFVDVVSKFTRKYGNKPDFSDFQVGIDNYLTNELKFVKPKWYQLFTFNEYTHQEPILNRMSKFFEKGLVNIKNLK